MNQLGAVRKLLVANRGEIACRVMKTARRLGVPTVAVYSKVDEMAKHVTYADEAFCIGSAAAKDSYLRKDRIIDVALRTGATHIHPGYGFLSENTDFAQDCASNGIKFVGPPASAIRAMGDKIESKVIMEKAGVPLVPGYHGSDQSLETLVEECKKIGFPVLVKAALGGGGKGMKVAQSEDECVDAIQSAQREALSSFGDQRVLLEKYVGQPRHIEVQVLADGHGNILHFYERDCSVQRRHQKIIEEAPAFGITKDFQNQLHKAAIDAARAVGYENAGTVEFLVDADTWEFYFMEMNTRLQVEHPVSESVTGVDLVELQLRVASGEEMPFKQKDVKCDGHAVEVRLYAENPYNDFLPATGDLLRLKVPPETTEFALTDKVRVDSGVRQGDSVTDYYDPMIAKMITKGKDRAEAITSMQKALGELQIADLPNNVGFLQTIMKHEKFLEGDIETNFIPKHEKELFAKAGEAERRHWLALALALRCKIEGASAAAAASPWGASDGFRGTGISYRREIEVELDGDDAVVTEVEYGKGGEVIVEGQVANMLTLSDSKFEIEIDGQQHRGDFAVADGASGKEAIHVFLSGGSHFAAAFPAVDHTVEEDQSGKKSITSPMPGRVVQVFAEDGMELKKGDAILAIEAMKMEYIIRASKDGVISGLSLQKDTKVGDGAVLAYIVDPVAA
ncbi:subunit alpha of methylcrotonoyl-CoA carboxylase [Chloropicon primus]|nr:subunit alpha of methylcrotonoyl-CoA carboxylase [Chloropicon primus]